MITYDDLITQKQWGMIIKKPLQDLNLANVDAIALHHMAHPTADIKDVEGWHLTNPKFLYRAFGYNFWVGLDGKIYEGRGFQMGAGVFEQNDHIISIGFQGDYHSKPVAMPDAQFNSGIDIIQYVQSKVPTAKKTGGHREFMATACPGQYFPLAEMLTGVKRSGKISYDATVDNLLKDDIIIVEDMVNWEQYLDARESPIPPEFVRALLDRYHEKLHS